MATDSGGDGAPGRNRTCDLRIRSPTLYPTELQAREMRKGVEREMFVWEILSKPRFMPPDSDFVQKNLISAGGENKRTSCRNISRQNFIGSEPLVQACGFPK